MTENFLKPANRRRGGGTTGRGQTAIESGGRQTRSKAIEKKFLTNENGFDRMTKLSFEREGQEP